MDLPAIAYVVGSGCAVVIGSMCVTEPVDEDRRDVLWELVSNPLSENPAYGADRTVTITTAAEVVVTGSADAVVDLGDLGTITFVRPELTQARPKPPPVLGLERDAVRRGGAAGRDPPA